MMPFNYESAVTRVSTVRPGVSYRIVRMSIARRIDLMRLVRELTARFEFQEAGGEVSQMDAAILSAEVDRLYLRWGLQTIDGFMIDGQPATPESLVLDGPENLFQEALAMVQDECRLSDDEKKT